MEEYALIPQPQELHNREGEFVLRENTIILSDLENHPNAVYLRDLLKPATGYPFPIEQAAKGAGPSIRLKLIDNPPDLGDEGYILEVSQASIDISALTPVGIFHGIQTLRQLLPAEIESGKFVPGSIWKVPCLRIVDWPRFSWRGFMLDEGRHFLGLDNVLRILDLMALHKLNIFHWHLTEDQGWRLEIKSEPRLTEVGAWRGGTANSLLGKPDGIPHGGFYTQQQVCQVVAYAASRHILVVPEIEMPGHCLAALASYPELSCTGKQFEVAQRFGIKFDVFCAGKESVFRFLEAVLEEVLELFPSPFIHIGGDEVPKKRWKACPDCMQLLKGEKLDDMEHLQLYFTNRVAAFLSRRGRRIIGWNQAMKPGLLEEALIQYWAGDKKVMRDAVIAGRQVIMSPFLETYLDHSYDLTPLKRAYRFEPSFLADGMDESNILGLEAPLWTEFVPNQRRQDYQVFPRLCAFAETGWSARKGKDYQDFLTRLNGFLQRLDQRGVGYAPPEVWDPGRIQRFFAPLTIFFPKKHSRSM